MYNSRVKNLHRFAGHAAVLALLLACIFIWTAAYAAQGQGRGVVTFAMLNVGQGDALFIEGPTGIQIMVDAGPNTGAALRALPRVMPLGDRTIDAAVETHPDADHVGGFIDVLERYEVASYVTPGINKENTLTHALQKKLAEQKTPLYLARRSMVLDLGGGAYLEVLYPNQDVSGYGNKTNDGCIVMRLVYGEAQALLACDAAVYTETHLLAAASSSLKSTILKVGHHGSKTSSSEAFLAVVEPDIALISVGAKNSYGHPTQEVLSRLQSAGAQVLRTDQKGTVVCTSSGASFECKSEE